MVKIDTVYVCMGANNHSDAIRETHDFYATEPKATELLLENESFFDVLEPACGKGHISRVLVEHGIKVKSMDLIDRGYGDTQDFFHIKEWNGDIVTNPPYQMAQKFVEHALNIVPEGRKVAMFLRLLFLEGKARKKLYLENPPKIVYVSSSRLKCAKNAAFEDFKGSAVAFSWFVWEKGYKGDTVIKWIN